MMTSAPDPRASHHEPSGDPPKKKKRTLGSFPCAHCDKVFTRSDHLARHNLNHEPKEVFKCDFVIVEYGGNKRICGKTFVRKDLRERHMKRHMEVLDVRTNASSETAAGRARPERKTSDSASSLGDESPLTTNGTNGGLPVANLVHENESGKRDDLAGHLENITPGMIPGPGNPYNGTLQPTQPPHYQSRPQAVLHGQSFPGDIPPPIPEQHGSYPLRHPSYPVQPGNQHNYAPQDYYRPPNINNTLPQSQNDILSWLFTDSPSTNMIQGQDPGTQPSIKGSLENGTFRAPLDFPLTQMISSPYVGPKISPPNGDLQASMAPNFRTPEVLTTPSQAISQASQPPQPPSNRSDESLAPFYNFNNPALTYELQDVNIFSNEENPLDEVFINKRLQPNGKNHLLDISSVTTPVGIPLASTGSSNSPTDSNSSRHPSIAFSPDTIAPANSEPLESKLTAHRHKYNTPKNQHMFIDTLIIDSFTKAIPQITRAKIISSFKHDELQEKYAIEDRLSYYLSIYWLVFHKQFTFLHKPSFDTKSAPPLLLLAMILIGCNYSSPDQSEHLAKNGKKSPEFKFSMMIAVPLRYSIFEHNDFQSPVKLWILQSLVLLEWSEKNFLSRRMHERAHVHHGTTVQLLRRSPLLGGNPTPPNKKSTSTSGSATSAGEDESDTVTKELAASKDTSDYDLFVKWVEAESMKRITFMTFYLDTIDYIKFRHNPQITIYQLQLLSIPSDDEHLWDANEVNGSFRKIVKRQKKLQNHTEQKKKCKVRHGTNFLNVLKKLLKSTQNSEPTYGSSLSSFGRKILLAGLVSIMFHLQQSDDQNSSSLLTSNGITNGQKSKAWKAILSKAFDNWNTEILQNNSPQYLSPVNLSIFNDINTSQVPIPMYHLSQVIGMSDINHFDIAIYGGSPANQSVEASIKDQYIVQRKLNKMWLNSSPPHKRSADELINYKSIIHCFMLLWQLMLKPMDDDLDSNVQYLEWNVNHDYFDSMYAVSICTLVLWCYSFSTMGIESNRFSDIKDANLYSKSYDELVQLSAEGGFQYLARVRQEFLTHLRKDNLHKLCNIFPFKPSPEPRFTPHEVLTKYCDILPHITNKQNMSGLCFLVGTKLLNSQWEVIRENAKLILNCGYRSIGKKEVICQELFGEFAD